MAMNRITLAVWASALMLIAGCRDWFPPTDPKNPDPPAYGLTDTRWCLTMISSPGAAPVKIDPALGMYAEFGADGRMSGFGGCNGFGGDYETAGAKITISNLFGTDRWCDQESRYEDLYMQGMMGATSYRISGSTLTIYYGGSGHLDFSACKRPDPPPPALVGTKWCLVSYAGDLMQDQPADSTQEIFVVFNPDGSIDGKSGCNLYGGSYTLSAAGGIKVTPAMMTAYPCNAESGRWDSYYRYGLASVEHYSIDAAGNLLLSSPLGTRMKFRNCN